MSSLPIFSVEQQLQYLQDLRSRSDIEEIYTPAQIATLDLRITQLQSTIVP